jgi:hypothetical protein
MSERKERMFTKVKKMLVGVAALGALAVGDAVHDAEHVNRAGDAGAWHCLA